MIVVSKFDQGTSRFMLYCGKSLCSKIAKHRVSGIKDSQVFCDDHILELFNLLSSYISKELPMSNRPPERSFNHNNEAPITNPPTSPPQITENHPTLNVGGLVTNESNSVVTQERSAWAVIINSDLNEGLGRLMIKDICRSKTTAVRLAKGVGVQGRDGSVKEVTTIKYNSELYGPVEVLGPTNEDIEADRDSELLDKVTKKILNLDLSCDELEILGLKHLMDKS